LQSYKYWPILFKDGGVDKISKMYQDQINLMQQISKEMDRFIGVTSVDDTFDDFNVGTDSEVDAVNIFVKDNFRAENSADICKNFKLVEADSCPAH
jgi:hypothetical protein